jgi:hypothetical protein
MVWHCVCRIFWSSVTKHSALHLSSPPSLNLAWIIPVAAPPNKPPEPTTFAVTSRAIVRVIEMKQQIPDCGAARAAPAKVVAHL